MLYGQSALHQILYPEGLLCCLTFWTVPVTTAVIAIAYRATALACLLMTSKRCGSATGYFAQNFSLQGGEWSLFYKLGAKGSDHIGQFKLTPCSSRCVA